MAKSQQRILAMTSRKNGQSIKEIAHKLAVSPSTVSIWCREIELTPDQIKALELRMSDPQYGKRKIYLDKKKRTRLAEIEKQAQSGIKEIGDLNSRDLMIVGASLYWAEGFKKDKQIGFANSDPYMIRIIIRWFIESLGIDLAQIRARVTVNQNYKDEAMSIQQYWENETHLQKDQFQKPTIQVTTWKKKYEKPGEYKGVLRLRVSMSLEKLRYVLGLIRGLQCNHML